MTLWYRAPEIMLDTNEYTLLIDNWSAGVIIFEILVGYPMFQGNSQIEQLTNIFQLKGTPVYQEKISGKQTYFGYETNKRICNDPQ